MSEDRPTEEQLARWARNIRRQSSYNPMYDGPAFFYDFGDDDEEDEEEEDDIADHSRDDR